MSLNINLWNIFETSLLCLNAACILNEERTSKKDELCRKKICEDDVESKKLSTEQHLMNVIESLKATGKIPLILLNLIVILLKIILG